ncbi:MAG: ABC transporter substrate-binding protein [Acidobacteriota bacterium]
MKRIAFRALALSLCFGALVLATACARAPEGPDTLRVRLRHEPATLDPAFANDVTSTGVLGPIFDSLVSTDPETLEIRPALASAWEISDDGLVYTFHLREGAQFHHGRPVEAQDVVFSLTRLADPEHLTPGAEILESVIGSAAFREGRASGIEGLETPDDRTVRLRLEHPYGPLLARLSSVSASIVPRDIYNDPHETYLRHPVGSGPYRFTEWRAAQWLRLESFEHYPGGVPAIPRIEFRIIADLSAALAEFRRGELDILDELPPGARRNAPEEFGDQLHLWPILATTNIVMNLAVPPLAGNPQLRRAINLAVNRKHLCEVIMEGVPRPASGILPPGMPGFDPQRPPLREDVDEARRLMTEAGYPNGDGLPPLVLLFNANPRVQQVVEQVQIDLTRIGVRLELRTGDQAAFLEALSSGTWGGRTVHLVRLGWNADYPDPDAFLGIQLLSRNAGLAGNFSHYSDPEVDALIEEARSSMDERHRMELYRKIERLAVDRDACWLFLYFHRDEVLVARRVRGLRPLVTGDTTIPFEKLSLGG